MAPLIMVEVEVPHRRNTASRSKTFERLVSHVDVSLSHPGAAVLRSTLNRLRSRLLARADRGDRAARGGGWFLTLRSF